MDEKPMDAIRSLSLPERIALVEEIWESIAQEANALSVSPEEPEEASRRLDAHRQDSGSSRTLEELLRELSAV